MKRRSQHHPSGCESNTLSTGSADGVISFTLAPRANGIHVQRVQVRTGTARVVQSMLFPDDASFIRWCDADSLKFTYPLVYSNLRRNGCALFTCNR